METALQQLEKKEVIDSRTTGRPGRRDGRARQESGARVQELECVNKSWPQFWGFIQAYTGSFADLIKLDTQQT